MIVKVGPKMEGKNILEIDKSKKEISVTLTFNTPPMTRDQYVNHEKGPATEDHMSHFVILKLVNDNNGNLNYAKRPIRI